MAGAEEVEIGPEQQEATIRHLMNQSVETILHNLLLEVHAEEKLLRMQTAVIELEIRAEKLGKSLHETGAKGQDDGEPVSTVAALATAGEVQLKGNPMQTVKQLRCPNCRLPRLLYPRVGFNSRPVPDPTAQYCKQEPMIIVDKHDVHGQRKKGVKVKGQAKGKNKKGKAAEIGSPGSNNSDPLTPSSSLPEAFEYKEIDYPAAKCPNRNSHLGDHWKAVNLFATHLNGSCWLRRDRAAMREAKEKITSTPKDSRASSPKPVATNGTKRKADEKEDGQVKKKQKTGAGGPSSADVKKSAKKSLPGQPSKLREESSTTTQDDKPAKTETNDTIHVASKAGREQSVDSSASQTPGKLKFSNPAATLKKSAKKDKK